MQNFGLTPWTAANKQWRYIGIWLNTQFYNTQHLSARKCAQHKCLQNIHRWQVCTRVAHWFCLYSLTTGTSLSATRSFGADVYQFFFLTIAADTRSFSSKCNITLTHPHLLHLVYGKVHIKSFTPKSGFMQTARYPCGFRSVNDPGLTSTWCRG
jgi:hypothetical protein